MIFRKSYILLLFSLLLGVTEADNGGSIRHSSSSELSVGCGGENAPTCAECGPDGSFCNGECEWVTDKCKLKNQSAAPPTEPPTEQTKQSTASPTREPTTPMIELTLSVSCGGLDAPSCAKCGPGGSFCNGDCKWIDNECKTKFQDYKSCGGDELVSDCENCSGEENCKGDCKWVNSACQTRGLTKDQKIKISVGVIGPVIMLVGIIWGVIEYFDLCKKKNHLGGGTIF